MNLKIVATYNSDKLFTGLTQIPAGTELIEGQTDILPKNEKDNYWTGTAWIHKEIPTDEQQLAMQQQMEIMKLKSLLMRQQTEIMNLKKEVRG